MKIRPMEPADWPSVSEIYAEGIASRIATFETAVPAWEVWNREHLPGCRFVAEEGGQVRGWAALSPVSDRCAYAGVAEVSVYVAAARRGLGVGARLLDHLIRASEEAGIWTLQAGIFPENEVSIALHEACGFRIVGRREGLDQMYGTWRDVILMERRSKTVGV